MGLNQQASDVDIKKAYKKLAMKHHPDRNDGNPESTEAFKEVKKAYDVLSDPQKKTMYDQYGHAGVDQANGGGAGAGDFGDAFGDIFGDIFGGGGRQNNRSNVYRGADLRYNMELTLEKAAKGTETKVRIPVLNGCKACSSTTKRRW